MAEININIDYYLDEFGRMVFTKEYHLKRGYCCGNDCKHCPWRESENEIDSETSSELQDNYAPFRK